MNDEVKAKGFRRPRAKSTDTVGADWGEVDPKLLVQCVATIARKQGALRLGYTRDGGAYAIGVYAGPDYFTDYVRPHEDINAYLQDLLDSIQDYAFDSTEGLKPQKLRKAK